MMCMRIMLAAARRPTIIMMSMLRMGSRMNLMRMSIMIASAAAARCPRTIMHKRMMLMHMAAAAAAAAHRPKKRGVMRMRNMACATRECAGGALCVMVRGDSRSRSATKAFRLSPLLRRHMSVLCHSPGTPSPTLYTACVLGAHEAMAIIAPDPHRLHRYLQKHQQLHQQQLLQHPYYKQSIQYQRPLRLMLGGFYIVSSLLALWLTKLVVLDPLLFSL